MLFLFRSLLIQVLLLIVELRALAKREYLEIFRDNFVNSALKHLLLFLS